MTEKMEEVIKRCDLRMLRYLPGVKWKDKMSSQEGARRCRVKEIHLSMIQRRLQWFGHARRENKEGVLRKIEEMEITSQHDRA